MAMFPIDTALRMLGVSVGEKPTVDPAIEALKQTSPELAAIIENLAQVKRQSIKEQLGAIEKQAEKDEFGELPKDDLSTPEDEREQAKEKKTRNRKIRRGFGIALAALGDGFIAAATRGRRGGRAGESLMRMDEQEQDRREKAQKLQMGLQLQLAKTNEELAEHLAQEGIKRYGDEQSFKREIAKQAAAVGVFDKLPKEFKEAFPEGIADGLDIVGKAVAENELDEMKSGAMANAEQALRLRNQTSKNKKVSEKIKALKNAETKQEFRKAERELYEAIGGLKKLPTPTSRDSDKPKTPYEKSLAKARDSGVPFELLPLKDEGDDEGNEGDPDLTPAELDSLTAFHRNLGDRREGEQQARLDFEHSTLDKIEAALQRGAIDPEKASQMADAVLARTRSGVSLIQHPETGALVEFKSLTPQERKAATLQGIKPVRVNSLGGAYLRNLEDRVEELKQGGTDTGALDDIGAETTTEPTFRPTAPEGTLARRQEQEQFEQQQEAIAKAKRDEEITNAQLQKGYERFQRAKTAKQRREILRYSTKFFQDWMIENYPEAVIEVAPDLYRSRTQGPSIGPR